MPFVFPIKANGGGDMLVVGAGGVENETRNAAIFEKLGRTTGLPDIAERVPSARRPALAALMEKNSFTNGTLTPYESWAAALLLSSGLQKDLKLKTGGGVESQLEPRFLKKGKPIIGLETVEGQLGIFDSLPEAAQRQFLTQVVEEADSADNTYKIMVTAWLSGDVERLSHQFMAEFGDTPALVRPLLTNRNKSWARQVEALMRRPGTPLIAVGTGDRKRTRVGKEWGSTCKYWGSEDN